MSNNDFDWSAFGDEIARLRNLNDWSRPDLVRALTLLPKGNFYLTSDESLERLENGKTIKLPRSLVLSLAEALKCTTAQTAFLLFLSDKKPLSERIWISKSTYTRTQ